MNSSATFGVIGGSGNTGKAVVKELCGSTDRAILIGGRNLAKLEAVAAELGTGVSAIQLDVRDPRSLEEFCARCSVVVNCGRPGVSFELSGDSLKFGFGRMRKIEPHQICEAESALRGSARFGQRGRRVSGAQVDSHLRRRYRHVAPSTPLLGGASLAQFHFYLHHQHRLASLTSIPPTSLSSAKNTPA